MAKDTKSVLYYTPARIEYDFGFPNSNVACYYCPFCYKDGVGRERCTITGEILMYACTERGKKCPAVVQTEKRIQPAVRVCPACGLVAEGAEKYCLFCGRELPPAEEYQEGRHIDGNTGIDPR